MSASARPLDIDRRRPPSPGPGPVVRGTLLAGASLTIMAAAIIAPSLPEMRTVFAATPGADVLVRVALTVTSLTIAVTAPVVGVLVDRIGRKPVLVGSLLLYTVAGGSGLLIEDLWPLLVARALLGVAVGGLMTSVTATVTDLFDGAERARFLGLQQAFASLGGVVFLPAAGMLAASAWSAPSWIYLGALLIVPTAVLALGETRPEATAATARPTTSRPSARGDALRWLLYATALFATLVFFMAPTQLPFLVQRFEVSTTGIGLVVAASTASGAVAAVLFGRAKRLLGYVGVLVASLVMLGAGWVLIGVAGSLWVVVLGVLVGGVGVGLVVPDLNLWLSETVPADRRGRALAGLVSAIFLGQFLSPLALQPVIVVAGLSGAFVLAGVALLLLGVSVVTTVRVRRRPARPDQQSTPTSRREGPS